MDMMNKEPERHDIECLLPWYATGTLSRRETERVDRALAGDRELAHRYDLVREELAETVHLNETLGAPSARCMEKLFAAIDAEEARSPRRNFDLADRISDRISAFLSGFQPRTLAWAASAAVIAILVQAAVITAVVIKEDRGGAPSLASAAREGSFAVVRFSPQATANDITNFLGAYRASVVEGPLKAGGPLYRVRLADSRLPPSEVAKIVRSMQEEAKIVGFIAPAD
jgi:anti-sigma-K factor RskA